MKRAIILAALALSFCGVRSVNAGIILDQQQLSTKTSTDNPMATFSQPDLAQSFQQTLANITGAAVKLHPGLGTTGDITIALYDKLPNAGGVLLASGTALNAAAGTFAEVSFGSAVSIKPDTTYFLVFTSSKSDLGLSGDSFNNPYLRGQVYAGLGFQSFPDYDYTFKTFADDGTTRPPVNVNAPEPTSIILFSLFAGGGALYGWRRRGQTI